MKALLEIFFVFLKMGLATFGGGYAMIPIIERELIKKRGWLTMEEVMDYYTISQITPGIIAVNFSTFTGYKQKGVLGGLLATFGFILPGVTLIVAAAIFISNIASYSAVQHAFTGIRIAVGALVLDTVIKMVKGINKDKKALIIYIVVFIISLLPSDLFPSYLLFVKSPVTLVVISGLCGILFCCKRNTAEKQ